MERPRQVVRHGGGAGWLCLGLGAVLAACGEGSGRGASEARAGEPPRERVVPVEIAVAALDTVERSVAATGAVEPIRTVGVNSQLAGALLTVSVEEGDTVRRGQTLARLDGREIEAQLASAEAALEVARRAAERAEQLYRERIITEAEYERDRAAHAAALATRDQLRTRLGYASIRSPLRGVILRKEVEAGDVVANQTRLFTIGDVSTLVVRVPVSELDVPALDPGDRVDVALDALPGRPVQGRIRRVFPSADTVTRLVPVEVALTGAGAREVLPGFLARVTFHLDSRAGVLTVPAGAVAQNAGGRSVFAVRGGRAVRRPVETGATSAGRVEIVGGLSPGDTVVVTGHNMLRDGAAVRPVRAPAVDAAPADTGAASRREGTEEGSVR